MKSFIDNNQVNTFLKINNISHNLTDEELDTLIEFKINEIESATGRELNLTSHTDVELNFNNKENYNLKHFPVVSIESLKIDDVPIFEDSYMLDKENGRIKFFEKMNAETLTVNYISRETDSFIKTYILPLLFDMLVYSLENPHLKNASSIKEGNTSVNYDTNLSLNAKIIERLDKLKNRKGTITRML